ncbi:DUF932 domain-containing protein [Escherichia coli]|nr:DUF932 domain-containing protein [Escherichia coli]
MEIGRDDIKRKNFLLNLFFHKGVAVMRLAFRFGRYNSIRRERPLTDDELMQFVPSVFSGDKHESRSERYTYIPTINIINKLRDEGFQPFFACQSRVRDLGRREYSKHMLRLRREGHINGKEVPEIILLNSTVNICYVFAGKGILTGKKFLKLSCLIHMIVHPVIR